MEGEGGGFLTHFTNVSTYIKNLTVSFVTDLLKCKLFTGLQKTSSDHDLTVENLTGFAD